MKRALCVRLPNWPIQHAYLRQPALKKGPLVLYHDAGRGGLRVVTCSRAAALEGVTADMPLAEAKALPGLSEVSSKARLQNAPRSGLRAPRFEPYAPQSCRESLQKLAHWCGRYSPYVGLEEAGFPECLLLDITGCAHLFAETTAEVSGEKALAEQVVRELRSWGLVACTAVADTIGAAWAGARYGECGVRRSERGAGKRFNSVCIIPSGEQERFLQLLPVEALRLPRKMVETLQEFDIRTVAQLQKISAKELAPRFDKILLKRLDQAWGNLPELIAVEHPPEPIEAAWEFEYPTAQLRVVETVIERLLERIAERLEPRQEGVQRFECRLKAVDGEPVCLSVELVQPSASVPHLLELIRMQLERTGIPAEVSEVLLQVTSAVPLEFRQRELFDGSGNEDTEKHLAVLVERLSSRLGKDTVLHAQFVPDAQPEYAVRYKPFVDAAERGGRNGAGLGLLGLFRPLRLLSQPIAVPVTSLVPDGPPVRFCFNGEMYHVACNWGPERIETGWWRDCPIRRDYYRVQTECGRRLWLFRKREAGEAGRKSEVGSRRTEWFLQGVFE